MENEFELHEIEPKTPDVIYSNEHVISGIPIPKAKRIELFSFSEWEEFTEEWASSLKTEYFKVERLAGAGDKGLDVIAFVTNRLFDGEWDNYQCKHYETSLAPSNIWVELGKIIYYSFTKEYTVPRKYYFVASGGIGISLRKQLNSPTMLKEACKNNWAAYCENKISDKFTAPLKGELLTYFDNFDFSIFSSKSAVELIEGHSKTPFHAVRFGGGLPARPNPSSPPSIIANNESRYIRQIFEAYSEHKGDEISDSSDLETIPALKKDFLQQRKRFYYAESLKNFARDTVPPGTFESLQDEIYSGVIDICDSHHKSGFERMRATISESTKIVISQGPLAAITQVNDKQGICHQLANDDRLTWVQNNGTKDDE